MLLNCSKAVRSLRAVHNLYCKEVYTIIYFTKDKFAENTQIVAHIISIFILIKSILTSSTNLELEDGSDTS